MVPRYWSKNLRLTFYGDILCGFNDFNLESMDKMRHRGVVGITASTCPYILGLKAFTFTLLPLQDLLADNAYSASA